MIVNCVAYQNGTFLEKITNIDDISEVIKHEDTFVWLELYEPCDQQLWKIQEEFNLHELAIDDTQSLHQRPKLEEYGDSLFLVFSAVLLEKNITYGDKDFFSVAYTELDIFIGTKFFVLIRYENSSDYERIRTRCEFMPEQLAKGSSFVLYEIMRCVMDDYIRAIDDMQARFEHVENAIFDNRPSRKTIERLYELKRELLLLQNAVLPLMDVCHELTHYTGAMIHPEISVYFRDIANHLKRVDQSISGMREMLIAAMQVHLTFETIRQNEVVKQLAGWAAILTLPTVVFSWYGMNFENMPELKWEFSYPAVMGVVVVGCGLLYWSFKRSGWLR